MPTPPQAVRRAAQRGLDLREEFGRGGTATGIARARDLSNGSNIPVATIRRMKAFFDRHQGNKDTPPEEGNGRIAWLLWGGDPGRRWAERVLRAEDADKGDYDKNDDPPGTGRRGSGRNDEGSASSADNDIEISESTEEALRNKVKDHNGGDNGPNVTIGMLRAVYRRGAGAYSTSARARSRNQWAMARVNAFLHLVRNGRPKNSNYTQDNDLLPSSHERATKRFFEVAKVDDEHGLVFGFAIVSKINGEEYFDVQGDHIPEEAMLEASLDFMENSGAAKEMHQGDQIGKVVFAFPLTTDIARAMNVTTEKTGLMIAMKPTDPEVLNRFKSGEFTGFSIGGRRMEDEEVTQNAEY